MAVTSYSSSSSWSELLPELLNAVFHNLNSAGDILSCATVCSSWRDSSSDVYSRKYLPFLFISDEETPFSDQFRVLSYSGNDQRWVCGSTHGFLLTVNVSFPFEVYLQNPFTNTAASLPPLVSFEDVVRLLQSESIEPGAETLKDFLKKAVCSTNILDTDWVVLVIYNIDGKLAFCRRGDKQWTGLDSGNVASSVDDIVFCNGDFLAMDRIGVIYLCELSPNDPKAIPLCTFPPFKYDQSKKYFTETDYGNLWVVLKKVELNDDCEFTTNFEIYEFNSETKEWAMVRSLRGKALFLSPRGRSIAISAGETGSKWFIKDNTVYFVEGNDLSIGLGPPNLSVFEWDSKQITKLYQPRFWNSQMFWITPTDAS